MFLLWEEVESGDLSKAWGIIRTHLVCKQKCVSGKGIVSWAFGYGDGVYALKRKFLC